MSPENQDFESLRRLLKLKRYEQPPPRYFNEFSGRVIDRIRSDLSPARSEAAMEMTWLQRLLSAFDAKPLLAGAFGAVVVGVLVGGAVYSEGVVADGPASLAITPTPTALPVAVAPTPLSSPVAVGVSGGTFALNGGGSTNARSIFDAIGTPSVHSVQPVNYTPFQR